ncbi:MAG: cytochrome c biogenesis protein CcdA [Deltaproteobacteria bacterium]|jgi:cytochrome c-type biogenesis protein|nr:cytochrome c biogenesis protein CcdA [Deltaproteobacteria bacterium]
MFSEVWAIGAIVTQKVSLFSAFLAGIATFFTPCILPLLPVWLALVTGKATSVKETAAPAAGAFFLTLAFVLGFSAVFVAMGAAASALGQYLFKYQTVLRISGGIVIMLFGLSLTGVINPLARLEGRRLGLFGQRGSFLGSLAVGLAFAVGWTPCVGPVLGAILATAAVQSSLSQGTGLLGLFSLGMALPFLAIALMGDRILPEIKRLGRAARFLNFFLGLVLIAAGILLVSDKINFLASYYPY